MTRTEIELHQIFEAVLAIDLYMEHIDGTTNIRANLKLFIFS